MRLILGMIRATRKLDQCEKCLSSLVDYSKSFHFNYGVKKF